MSSYQHLDKSYDGNFLANKVLGSFKVGENINTIIQKYN